MKTFVRGQGRRAYSDPTLGAMGPSTALKRWALVSLFLAAGCSTSPFRAKESAGVRTEVEFGDPAFAFRRTEDLIQDAEVRVAVSPSGQMHLAWRTKKVDQQNPRRALEYDIMYSSRDALTFAFSNAEQVSLTENHVECDPGIAIIDNQAWVTYLNSATSHLAKRESDGRWNVVKLHSKESETDLPLIRPDGEGGAILAATLITEKGAGPAFIRAWRDPELPEVVLVPQISRSVHLRDIALLDQRRVALAVVAWRDEDETRDYRILVVDRGTGEITKHLAVPVRNHLVAYRYSLHQDWLDCDGTPQIAGHGSRLCAYWISQDEEWRFRLVFSVLDLNSDARWTQVRTVYTEPGRKIILHAAAVDPEGTIHFSWLSQGDDRLWSVYYARSRDWSTVDSLQKIRAEPFMIEAWPGYRRSMAVDNKHVYLAWPMRSKEKRGVMVCVGQHSR